MSYPALLPAVGLLAGVALGWHAPAPTLWPVAGCVVVGYVAATVALLTRATLRYVAFLATSLVAAGTLLGAAGASELRTPILEWYEVQQETAASAGRARPVVAVVEGRLRRDAVLTGYGVSLAVDVDRLVHDGHAIGTAGGVRVGVGGQFVPGRIAGWRAGRRVQMPVTLGGPARYDNAGVPDQQRALQMRGTSLLGSVKSALLVETVARGSVRTEWAADRVPPSAAVSPGRSACTARVPPGSSPPCSSGTAPVSIWRPSAGSRRAAPITSSRSRVATSPFSRGSCCSGCASRVSRHGWPRSP